MLTAVWIRLLWRTDTLLPVVAGVQQGALVAVSGEGVGDGAWDWQGVWDITGGVQVDRDGRVKDNHDFGLLRAPGQVWCAWNELHCYEGMKARGVRACSPCVGARVLITSEPHPTPSPAADPSATRTRTTPTNALPRRRTTLNVSTAQRRLPVPRRSRRTTSSRCSRREPMRARQQRRPRAASLSTSVWSNQKSSIHA